MQGRGLARRDSMKGRGSSHARKPALEPAGTLVSHRGTKRAGHCAGKGPALDVEETREQQGAATPHMAEAHPPGETGGRETARPSGGAASSRSHHGPGAGAFATS